MQIEEAIRILTPVQPIEGILFKRDDLFTPFAFSSINGSKVRQAILLALKNKDKVRNGIITGTSVLSPQGAITAAVAKFFGVPCEIYYGGTTSENLKKHQYPVLAASLGAHCPIVANTGRTTVLNHIVQERANKSGAYVVKYGFDMRNNLDCFIGSVADQVQNIPDELENLVMVVGSGITLTGVLAGIAKYKKDVGRVYAVGCAPNRLDKITEYAGLIKDTTGIEIDLSRLIYVDAFNTLKGYNYETTYNDISFAGIKFHPRYEAKAFKWLTEHLSFKRNNKTLFWINGAAIH